MDSNEGLQPGPFQFPPRRLGMPGQNDLARPNPSESVLTRRPNREI